MVYQTVQIMDEQKTKARHKTLPCIFSAEEHPECCTFFLIHTLALIEFVSCHRDSTMYEPSTPHSCLVLATPSVPNFMPPGLHYTINRAEYGNV